jgi:formylglycine-generating enzyme required for sulfatase activity
MARGAIRIAVAAVIAMSSDSVLAQPVPDYGYTWATVGAVNNRSPTQAEAPNLYPSSPEPGFQAPGAVDHSYRIATTEVTAAQWLEFITAYSPFYGGPHNDVAFTSLWIVPTGPNTYTTEPGREQWAIQTNWRFAAAYCNWLSNGKAHTGAAFAAGAYDTSTFITTPGGTDVLDQATHSPGAMFWIPSQSEWLKAAYYDPNRYGPGSEGYWMYTYGSYTPATPGLPSMGGQTNRGIDDVIFPNDYTVGQYPSQYAPWGLLDTSGNMPEWTETLASPDSHYYRITKESRAGFVTDYFDRVDVYTGTPWDSLHGLRLASQVPGPPTSLTIGGFLWAFIRRGTRRSA